MHSPFLSERKISVTSTQNVGLNLNRLSSFCLAKAFIPIYPEPNFESLAVRKTVRLDLYK